MYNNNESYNKLWLIIHVPFIQQGYFAAFLQLGEPLLDASQFDSDCYPDVYVSKLNVKFIAKKINWRFFNTCNTIFQDLFVQAWISTCFLSFIYTFASEGGGNLSVVCGSQLGRKTTSMLIYTTRLSNPSSVVSSMELIATSAINKNNSDATMSTVDILSEELKCDHRIGIFFSISDSV